MGFFEKKLSATYKHKHLIVGSENYFHSTVDSFRLPRDAVSQRWSKAKFFTGKTLAFHKPLYITCR